MKERIVQFGEGNFLRGFVDYFVHKLNEQGLYDGRVVVVQPIAQGKCDVLNRQNGAYNLFLRGLQNGQEVCEHTRVTSIARAVNPYEDFSAYLALAAIPALRFVVSNTTEAGIAFDPACKQDDAPSAAFPAKLTQLLHERFRLGLPGFVLLPCELIDRNAEKLKSCVLQYAKLWQLGDAFAAWVEHENTFCNTLVDRIVTGYPQEEAQALQAQVGETDALLNTAEPFHLWVIEGDFERELPLRRAGFDVIWTQDVTPYKKRKVRILNGGHTSMVPLALLAGLETVGDCMRDETVRGFLEHCLFREIVPTLGGREEDIQFAKDVLERFANPFIRHQLRSIALNSVSKFAVRVLPTLLEYKEQNGAYPRGLLLSFAGLLRFYKTDTPQDDAEIIAFMQIASTAQILQRADVWGRDLQDVLPLMEEALQCIEERGAKGAMQWAAQ